MEWRDIGARRGRGRKEGGKEHEGREAQEGSICCVMKEGRVGQAGSPRATRRYYSSTREVGKVEIIYWSCVNPGEGGIAFYFWDTRRHRLRASCATAKLPMMDAFAIDYAAVPPHQTFFRERRFGAKQMKANRRDAPLRREQQCSDQFTVWL